MKLSRNLIGRWLSDNFDGNVISDYASDYGEPGYSCHVSVDEADATPMVLFGNWWLRRHDKGYVESQCRSWFDRYPRLMGQLEAQGVQFDWCDEWIAIDDLAYRANHDSYMWQPSWCWLDEDYFVPTTSSDIEDIIDEVAGDPRRAINLRQVNEVHMEKMGFEHCNGEFASGWHPGQTDDPVQLLDHYREMYGDEFTYVFIISGVGQFDVHFRLFRRAADVEYEPFDI